MFAFSMLQAFWKPILAILAFLAIVGTIYYQGYQHGGANCREEWAKEEAARIESINKRIDEIKTASELIAKSQTESDKKVIASIDLIIQRLRASINKIGPSKIVYTTVENCKPSDAYVETWNEISKQANSK